MTDPTQLIQMTKQTVYNDHNDEKIETKRTDNRNGEVEDSFGLGIKLMKSVDHNNF